MRIGFLGLGKLGLPTALAIESFGHTVFGHDPSPLVGKIIRSRELPYKEARAQALLKQSAIELASLSETVQEADLLFVAIQTPHEHRFEGVTRLPAERQDFDYGALINGMSDLADAARGLRPPRVVLLVSTVLPGTVRRALLPLLHAGVRLCYNPFFIAMGTAIQDFVDPEFVLLGAEDDEASDLAESFYRTIHSAPVFRTSLENAELIKVFYNTFISTKIAFANTVMELCHKTPGTDADVVIDALALGTRRIVSPSYLRGGMGDGGACHPRDNIALSHLSRELGLSYDWFEGVMLRREKHTEWFAQLIEQHAGGREIVLLGKSFKSQSNIEIGSPARLLRFILEERGHSVTAWDPHVDTTPFPAGAAPTCYFVATKHEAFTTLRFPSGSTVLDPWRYIADQVDVEVVRIGSAETGGGV